MLYPAAPGQTWWVTALEGILAILFGLAALFWPGLTLMVLVALFGIYAIVYGIVEIVGMFRAIGMHTAWWPSLLIGVVSILAGIAVFTWPGITALTVLFIIAFWALAVGIFEVVAGLFQARFLLAVAGAVTIMFGFVLLANPVGGALALVMVIGAFAIVRGVLQLIEAARGPAGTEALK